MKIKRKWKKAVKLVVSKISIFSPEHKTSVMDLCQETVKFIYHWKILLKKSAMFPY